MANDSTTPDRLSHALALAELGYFVFPVTIRSREPEYIKGLCENGYDSATDDPDTIRSIWTVKPEAGIGIDLGRSGVVAVDCDTLEAEAEAIRNDLPATVERHSRMVAYLYRRPDNCPMFRHIKGGTSGKLDLLSSGGLVVENIHAEGHPVFLSEMVAPSDLPEAPRWVVQVLARATLERQEKAAEYTSGDSTADDAGVVLQGLACTRSGCACKRSLRNGHGLTHCPVHDDHVPSFNVDFKDGNVLVVCYAGCDQREIIHRLRDMDLWPEAPTLHATGKATCKESEPVALFPLDCLPYDFQSYVEKIARVKCCPPEYVAIPMLVSAGTMLGNVSRIKLNSTWFEGPQMFAAIVGDPGSKKSPALQAGLAPLRAVAKRVNDEFHHARVQYEDELADYKKLSKEERGKIEPPNPPVYKSVRTTDVTVEKLGEMLKVSKGIILTHDELSAWVGGMDQYRSGKGSDRQHFLSMWSGAGFVVDRKSSPFPLVVDDPCLGIVGGIQPEMLGALSDEKGRSDGFLDRILWAFPAPVPDRWVDDESDLGLEPLCDLWERLYACYGATGLDNARGPEILHLSAEAKSLWREWYDAHGSDRDDPQFNQLLGGPWAKMGTHLARITLILHYIFDEPTTDVSAETLSRGIRIVEYFKAHARRVFGVMGESRKPDDMKILEALAKGDMSTTEISSKVFHRNLSSDKLRPILARLEESGLIRSHSVETKGRAVTVWTITN